MTEDGRPVALNVLVPSDTVANLGQHRSEGGFANIGRSPRTAVERYPFALLAGDDAEAVVLDFVNPQAAGRQCVGLSGEARRDEPGREGTLEHAG